MRTVSSLVSLKNKTNHNTEMDIHIGIIGVGTYGLAQRLLNYLRNMNITFGSYIMRGDNKIWNSNKL